MLHQAFLLYVLLQANFPSLVKSFSLVSDGRITRLPDGRPYAAIAR